MSDASWENRGPDNCVECGVAAHACELDELGWCAGCVERHNHTCSCCEVRVENASELTDRADSGDLLCAQCERDLDEGDAERAHEAFCEDFYGGAASVTARELEQAS